MSARARAPHARGLPPVLEWARGPHQRPDGLPGGPAASRGRALRAPVRAAQRPRGETLRGLV